MAIPDRSRGARLEPIFCRGSVMGEATSDPFERAYDRGCMWAVAGGQLDQCPYGDEALAEWWYQGWEDGARVWHSHPGEPARRQRVR